MATLWKTHIEREEETFYEMWDVVAYLLEISLENWVRF